MNKDQAFAIAAQIDEQARATHPVAAAERWFAASHGGGQEPSGP